MNKKEREILKDAQLLELLEKVREIYAHLGLYKKDFDEDEFLEEEGANEEK